MLGHCTFSEPRYIALRNQLDELGYHYILGVESVHLVEQILSDFVHTTNNLYHYKQLSQRCIEEQRNFELGVAPYKKDNARLVQECNALHLKLMHTQEDALKCHKGLKRQLRKLEMENRDLRFVNSQQLARINELELECVDSKKLIEQQCIEYTGAASKKKIIPRSSSVSRGRLRKTVSEPLRVIPPSQKESCDRAGGQENQVPHISTLRSELSLLQEKCSEQADSLVLLNEMVRARDCEIARLSSLLEGGRPHKAVCEDFKCNNKFDELQEEVNRLTKTNKQLEDHLADAVTKQHEAMTRAIKLADRLEIVKRDTRYTEHDGSEEHYKDSSKFTQLQERLNQVERDLQYNKALHSRLETAQHDKKRLEESQGSSAEDRRKMTDRINQFTLIEQDLMEEIQHLKESSLLQKRRISELEGQVKSLEKGKKSSSRGSLTDVSPHRVEVAGNNGYIVEKLESERDQYYIRLKQQGEKLQALEANLEEVQLVLKDKDQQLTTLHQQLLELQRANRQLNQEKFDAQTQVDILFGDKEALEAQLKSMLSNRDTQQTSDKVVISQQPQEEQLASCQAELCQQRALYNQIKILQEQTDRALADAQSQLSAVQSELTTLHDRVQELERERSLLEREVTGLKAERNTQRSTLAQVDQERDTLLLAVDSKTEQLAALEQELKAKDTHLTKIKEVVADLQKKLAVVTDESLSKEQAYRSVERSVESLHQELEAAQRSRDSALRENRRLQDDLAAAIQDCRVANHSLEESRQEVENLKRQLQDYVDEVRRVEDILTLKEGERSEMLEHFRSLSVEATVLESNNHSLESEAEETRTALRVAQEHVADLERQVYSKDALVRSYENQISELTVHVASLETQLRQQVELRQQTEADLTAVRELCVNIDDQKEVLSKQNSDNDIVKIHLESELSRLREELEIMQQHVSKDRAAVSSLEDMLANSRHEAVEQRAANQSLQAQIAQLQTNITDLQEKLALETAEVRRYASQAAALNQQVTELQREVVNVRFNHARATEGQSYSTTL